MNQTNQTKQTNQKINLIASPQFLYNSLITCSNQNSKIINSQSIKSNQRKSTVINNISTNIIDVFNIQLKMRLDRTIYANVTDTNSPFYIDNEYEKAYSVDDIKANLTNVTNGMNMFNNLSKRTRIGNNLDKIGVSRYVLDESIYLLETKDTVFLRCDSKEYAYILKLISSLVKIQHNNELKEEHLNEYTKIYDELVQSKNDFSRNLSPQKQKSITVKTNNDMLLQDLEAQMRKKRNSKRSVGKTYSKHTFIYDKDTYNELAQYVNTLSERDESDAKRQISEITKILNQSYIEGGKAHLDVIRSTSSKSTRQFDLTNQMSKSTRKIMFKNYYEIDYNNFAYSVIYHELKAVLDKKYLKLIKSYINNRDILFDKDSMFVRTILNQFKTQDVYKTSELNDDEIIQKIRGDLKQNTLSYMAVTAKSTINKHGLGLSLHDSVLIDIINNAIKSTQQFKVLNQTMTIIDKELRKLNLISDSENMMTLFMKYETNHRKRLIKSIKESCNGFMSNSIIEIHDAILVNAPIDLIKKGVANYTKDGISVSIEKITTQEAQEAQESKGTEKNKKTKKIQIIKPSLAHVKGTTMSDKLTLLSTAGKTSLSTAAFNHKYSNDNSNGNSNKDNKDNKDILSNCIMLNKDLISIYSIVTHSSKTEFDVYKFNAAQVFVKSKFQKVVNKVKKESLLFLN